MQRLEGVQPAPTIEEGKKRPRLRSSSEETNERDVDATRKRVARIESSSSSPEERMEMEEMNPKPQRMISVVEGIASSRRKKKKKGKKRDPRRGKIQFFSQPLDLPAPLGIEFPPPH